MESTAEAPSAHELVADQIRDAIFNQELQPGDRLVEDRLAAEFHVSRHPVREALRTLQLEGLVEISPRRGATVLRISPQDAAEIFEVLAALDGVAARLAADACDAIAAADIAAVLDQASAALESDPANIEQLRRLSREFHLLISLASGNSHLTETIRPLRDRVRSIRTEQAIRPPDDSWREHQEMFDAIQRQDGAVAERSARAHIDAARMQYLKHTDKSKPATG